MAETTDLEALERFVAENDDLQQLEERVGRFNVFDALGVARIEIRHSNFLAWLLNPNESHGLGDLFLKSLLMDLLRKARDQKVMPPVSAVELDGADLRRVEVWRERKNIDLLVTCAVPRLVVAIENKIDSGEHGGQLDRYKRVLADDFPGVRPLLVLLTVGGGAASDGDWIAYGYADLHRALSRTRRLYAASIGHDIAVFIDHYLGLIGSRFMDDPEIDRLCRQIYTNHGRAIDLILARTKSSPNTLLVRARQWLDQRSADWIVLHDARREIIFIPRDWDDLLPPVGASKRLEPKHWLQLRLTVGRSVRLFAHVSATTDATMRATLVDRLTRDKREFGFSMFGRGLPVKRKKLWSQKLCETPAESDAEGQTKTLAALEERLRGLAAKLPAIRKAVVELGLSK